MLENQVKSIYLGIGSNLGNKKINIEKAKFELIQNKIVIFKISSYYETLSWPNSKNPKFLNIILKIGTNYGPQKLLAILKMIENKLGRKKAPKNSPRTCDIDIIDYQGSKIQKDIILPHARMNKRNFVLLPLFELDKNWKHPISKQYLKDLIYRLPVSDITSIKQI